VIRSSLPQRAAPLRRTPLRSAVSSGERRPAGRGLPARNPKRAAQERLYARLRAAFLAGKVCARCGTTEGLTVQHMRGRRGADLLEQRWWLPLCWPCHMHTESHRTEALANGWALPRTWKETA